ncbi:MAG: C39 family peptidase [Vicinamibacterales bacterium]|nr:C39 family peptidase [Vicinamibacterales bacterium]
MSRPRTAAVVAVTAFVLVATAAAADVRPAQPSPASSTAGRLLDVPYLPQTPDLCGGAAMAMVMRYWGARQIYPEDFEALVDRSAAGIRTDVLTADVQRRGWQALPVAAGAASGDTWMRGHINQGRPVVALIEVAPDRYHYVVVVAWTDDRVIAHDPARAPFRVLSRADFERAWAAAGRFALLVLPPEGGVPAADAPMPAATTERAVPADPCAALVGEMVAHARAGDLDAAEAGLAEAMRLCPTHAAAWREMAGVRFLQRRWGEASTLAARAARLDPRDAPGWDLLGTSLYLDGQPTAALNAWNHMGRPTVDLVRIEGAGRTRHPVIVETIDLPARTLLTAARFGRAARRLQALPGASLTRLSYRPLSDGLAEVEAAVVERSMLPRGVVPIATAAGRAIVQRELRLDAASPSGSGERWTVAWRWWEARPRVLFALAMPAPSGLPGVVTVEGLWERQSYATGSGLVRDDPRRRASVRLSDWAAEWFRWDVGVALDRWEDDSHAAVDVGLETRMAGDRVSLGLDAAAWTPMGSGARFARAGASAAWRSTANSARRTWYLSAGVAAASTRARFDVWPGAGTGHARLPLLRAHPLLDAGIVRGDAFGRRLAHATAEYHHPLLSGPAGTVAAAAFVDAARVSRATDAGRPWHVDAGAGLRVVLPGGAGLARLDLARGLRDGQLVFSAAWHPPWPGRQTP